MRYFSKFLLIFLSAFCVKAIAQKQPTSFFKKGDKVCFVGNSITHNGEFHHNILQYFVTRFPQLPISFYNTGIKGDETGGILQRLNTDILIHKPTHAIIMIGMNDVKRELYGKAASYNADTLAKRKAAIEVYGRNLDSIVQIFLKKGIKVILQKPSAYDQTSTIKYPNNLGVNDALIACGVIMQNLANKYKLFTIDYNSIMTDITNTLQQKNPTATLTVNDRVHPNSTGHFIMSYQFLKAIKAPSLVSKIEIDVKKVANKIVVENGTIASSSFNNNVLSFKVVANSLPFVIADPQKQGADLVPFIKDFNHQIIQIKNLEKGTYQLKIDSTIIDNFTTEALQNGVNLANFKHTPPYKQALQVKKTLELLWQNEATIRAIAFTEYKYLNSFNQKNNMVATKQFLDSLFAAKYKGQAYFANAFEKYVTYKLQLNTLFKQADSLRALAYKQAQPIAHNYTVNKVQEPSVAALIEASQSAAMPLLFDVQSNFLVKEVHNFENDKEYFVRDGLPNFFKKINQPNSMLTIGFLGGSITKAHDQYRNQTLAFIQTLNPTAKLKGINAGVSGTGTELGSCRVGEQVLQYNPDLVFVEFAVNGGSNEAMEGIVRKIKKHNPLTDICFIYTIAGEQYKQYAANGVPGKIQGFEKVATYYKLPSIHMGLYPSLLESQGKLIWKSTEDVDGKIVFSKDGTHPAKAGGDLYAQAISRAFNSFKTKTFLPTQEIPKLLYANNNWEDGDMFTPEQVGVFSKGWQYIKPIEQENIKAFAPWFTTLATTTEADASFTFKFKGTAFGFFDIGGPEVGQVLIEVDGNCAELNRKAGNASNQDSNSIAIKCLKNRFNKFCNNRYRGQFELYEVAEGEHTVKISLSNLKADKVAILQGQDLNDIQNNPSKYEQQVFYLGKILVRGEIIK